MGKIRAGIAGAVVAALVATALPVQAATPAGSSGRVDELIRLLAKSGIATVEDPTDTEPVVAITGDLSPVRLLRDQVENMALELEAENGVLGSTLDDLAPFPEGAPSISYLIAGFVTSNETAVSRAAKKIMGRQDWANAPTIEFPGVVLALFTHEMVRALSPDFEAPALEDRTAPASGAPAGGANVKTGAVAAVCSALSSYISIGVSAVYDALTFANAGEGSAQAFWNQAVKWFIEGVGAIIGVAIDVIFPYIEAVKTAVGVVAAVHAISALFVNWHVKIEGKPSSAHFGVAEPGVEGQFVATVIASNAIEWPAGVEACAELLDVTLPTLNPKGAPISWLLSQSTPDAALTNYQSTNYDADAKLDADFKATLSFTTPTETKKIHNEGEPISGSLGATAAITRTDAAALAPMLKAAILNQVPGVAAGFVNPVLEAQLTPLIDKLTTVADPYGHGDVTITGHRLNPCKVPDASVDPCLIGEWRSKVLALPFPPDFKYAGGTGAHMSVTANGQVTIDYEPSTTLGVNFAGVPGFAKLHGKGTATVTTEFETKGTGTISSITASTGAATADVGYAGVKQTISLGGPASLNGSYVINYLDDPNQPDEFTLTVPTAVGPVIAIWVRVS